MLGWPESVDTKDKEESLRCELVDRDPPGERGRGGGRSGGKRSPIVAVSRVRAVNDSDTEGEAGVEVGVKKHSQHNCATSAPALPQNLDFASVCDTPASMLVVGYT